ncbi:MAG TPA: peptidoglycan-binding domain-containing protein [Clostridia bacterium]
MIKRSSLIISVLLSSILLTPVYAQTSQTLKEGMSGNEVKSLQQDLKGLGFLNANATGYYGTITTQAVKKLQSKYKISPNGIAGNETLALIDRLRGRKSAPSKTVSKVVQTKTIAPAKQPKAAVKVKTPESTKKPSKTPIPTPSINKSPTPKPTGIKSPAPTATPAPTTTPAPVKDTGGCLVPWFGVGENIFSIGTKANVYDIDTGLSFNIVRSFGYNHADCETLTAEDTRALKKIFGGNWSWDRRAVVLTIGTRKIAASIAGMPHAGVDSMPVNTIVPGRSGDYGTGENLDNIKGNNMDGHFDVHLYGSKTHVDNSVDSAHQKMVQKAADWINSHK